MNVKVLVFDFDDTLTKGSREGYYASYGATATALGVAMSNEELRRRIDSKWGQSVDVELMALFEGYKDVDLEQALEIYNSHYLEGDTFTRHVDLAAEGVVPALGLLVENGYKLAIATGMHPGLLEKVMLKLGIPLVLFVQKESSYTHQSLGKPHRFMLDLIAETQGVKKTEMIMIGDAPTDLRMAHEAGVMCVAVATGGMDERKAHLSGAHLFLDDVTRLTPQIIQEMKYSYLETRDSNLFSR